MTRTPRHDRGTEGGAVMLELGVFLPLLFVVILATVDLGRLVYTNQMMADLSREAAMLVSRGASSDEAFAATFLSDAPLDVESEGGVIISRVRRRNIDDSQPWVFTQDRAGGLEAEESRVGMVGGPADIPDVDALGPGITIMTVEVLHGFTPVFGLEGLGLDFYPEVIYDASYF